MPFLKSISLASANNKALDHIRALQEPLGWVWNGPVAIDSKLIADVRDWYTASHHKLISWSPENIGKAWQNSELGLTGWKSSKAVLPEQIRHSKCARNAGQGESHAVSLSCLTACQGQVCMRMAPNIITNLQKTGRFKLLSFQNASVVHAGSRGL